MGRAVALHMAYVRLIYGIVYGSQDLPGIISEQCWVLTLPSPTIDSMYNITELSAEASIIFTQSLSSLSLSDFYHTQFVPSLH